MGKAARESKLHENKTVFQGWSRDKSPEARQNMLRNLFRVPRASVMIQSVRHGRDAYVATTAIHTKSLYE